MSHTTQHSTDDADDAQLGADEADVSAQLEALRERVDGLEAALRDVRAENKQLRSELADVSEHADRLDDGVRNAHNRIGSVEEQIDTGSATTELEVAIEMAPERRKERYSVSERRAITVATNIRDVGGPQGAKADKELKRAVERDRDEDLQYTQLYRACDKLERMSNGTIEFIDDDGSATRLHINDEDVLP
jgi:chromosome segregation ATPase